MGQICLRNLSMSLKYAEDVQQILTPCKIWSGARFFMFKMRNGHFKKLFFGEK